MFYRINMWTEVVVKLIFVWLSCFFSGFATYKYQLYASKAGNFYLWRSVSSIACVWIQILLQPPLMQKLMFWLKLFCVILKIDNINWSINKFITQAANQTFNVFPLFFWHGRKGASGLMIWWSSTKWVFEYFFLFYNA